MAALLLAVAAPAQGAQVVSVYPTPGTRYNLPSTQISFRGVAPSQLGQVQVTGSATGVHTGKLEPHSDNDGASFVPDAPFARGETVTVTTPITVAGTTSASFSFAIAQTDGAIKPMPLPLSRTGTNEVQYFHSRPDLQPPSVTIDKDSAPDAQGDIFVAPQNGPSENGPMILDPHGRLIWFDSFPVKENQLITDFREQTYQGKPALTWWQGFTNHGSGQGEGIIFNQSYQRVAVVQAGNGLMMDLHEFLLTPQGNAWVIAVSPVWCCGVHKPVMDAIVQEIDVPTGLVMFEWHALDHVATTDSMMTPKAPGFVYDPFHLNSVAPAGSSLLISMRNTSAVYDVDQSTGRVRWELGGKHSSFKLGKGTSTAFQHNALPQSDGTFTIFDDGGGPPTLHPNARGIRIRLDTRHHTASLVQEYDHSPQISTNFEGNVQPLSGGDVFMGWGQQPYFSEDDAGGHQIFDARFTAPTTSYRAYRFNWSGQPTEAPALAVGAGPDGTTNAYASWNGATTVTAWRVLTGTSATSLAATGNVADRSFETAIPVHTSLTFFQVQALGSGGQILATSPVQQVGPHIALYGRSAFVSHGVTGAIPAGCLSPKACSISTSISVGRTVIATTGKESVGAGGGGLLYFSLNSAGRSMIARARGHQLSATVTSRDASGLRSAVTMTLVGFSTRGSGPKRSVKQAAPLSIVGLSDFVSSHGVGGILAGCSSTSPCFVNARLTAGITTIATTGREFIAPGELGYVIFSLTAAGRSMLAHAAGNQLGTTVTLSGNGATATGQLALVQF